MTTEFCPNCGRRGDANGNELYCEHCDDTFTITKKEVKLKNTGRMDSLERRVSALEGTPTPPATEGQPGALPSQEAPETSPDDDDGNDL